MNRPTLSERLAHQFYAWEVRGRGWLEYPFPVALEPPFRPFPGHSRPAPLEDDGHRPSFLARLLAPRREIREEPEVAEPEPTPAFSGTSISEYRVSLPLDRTLTLESAERFLLSLSGAQAPLAFEIVGRPRHLGVQFACDPSLGAPLCNQLRAFFPEASVVEESNALRGVWTCATGETVILHFGLAREFMLPLAAMPGREPDTLLPLFGALSDLGPGEAGLVQVLFTPAREEWAESVIRAVHNDSGAPFFRDSPELTARAKEKVSRPLFAVCLRVGAKSPVPERAWSIVRDLAGALTPFGDPEGNGLLPLAEEGEEALQDLFARATRRPGMLLGSGELASLVHLPGASVRLSALDRASRHSKAAPEAASGEGVLLGENRHLGRTAAIRLPRDLRMRHVHLVGASGSGKSTLLSRMILQDLAAGEGVAVLDPHGDLVDEILGRFPEERERDLILFDPGDDEVALGWNMLQARSETEKILVASDLVGVFRRLSTSWGDQMNSVLANAIVAFLESDREGTLLELRRFLVDREFRAEYLTSIEDPEVLFYWQREFPLLVGKPQGPILTRLDTFLRPKPVRRVVVEREHRLDFRGIVDGGQVFLAKLAQGAIGEENASLLGSLLVSAFHQAAMSRQDLSPGARRHFFLYLDEFHEFATPSMASLLTGARKYRLGLTLAHQELRQLESKDREVASAVLGNAATRIVFRVGEEDARDLARGFSSFEAGDLVNLGVGEAVARLERADHDFNLTTAPLPQLDPGKAEARREALRTQMRERFPRPRDGEGREAVPAPAAREPEPIGPPVEPAQRAAPVPARAREPVALPKTPKAPLEREPAPLGRGGPEHQYLQDLVKRFAESHGYRAVVEEEIPGGKGKVDVALRTDEVSIACEISVTSTVAQEVGNALKCLQAGFEEVAILGLKRPRLQKIEATLKARLSEAEMARVHVVSPEEFFALLSLRPQATETVVGGYKVKVRRTTLDSGEEAIRYRALSEVIAKGLKRARGGETP